MACWWFASSQRKALEEHLGATLTIMGENIDEYFMSLEKLGFGVSSNWSVINVYSGEDPTEVGSAVANSHQLMSLLCSIETSIADVMIVDINGLGKSYFSGVDYNIISEITSQEELHDPYALERSFHFFPPESQWSNVYFVYSVPILNLNSWPSDSQKVATGLLLCNKSRISRLLRQTPPFLMNISPCTRGMTAFSAAPPSRRSLGQTPSSRKSPWPGAG